jgi:amino acid transporter
MTDKTISPPESPHQDVQRLKRNAVGTMSVIFMAVATAAPITAMVGNVPIAVGFGNGSHAPGGYIVATVVLGLFAVGYATMAKHITATVAFYGYISHGLGRIVGMASGLLITMAYVVFEASLIGIFSFFFQNLLKSQFDVTVHWIVPALLMVVLNCLLTYFDVNLAAKVLGVFLVTEIVMLSLGALGVLFHGGGPEGFAIADGITLVIILSFLAAGMDPYVHMYTLLAILGTMAILIVQSLCAFSVISYFHFHKQNQQSAHWFKTFLAPLLGGIGMLYVVYLLWVHKDAAAGTASGTLLFKLTLWIVVGLFVLGAAMATYFKFRDTRRYDMIGRIVYEDNVVRD